eukprot:282475_1
MDECQSGNLIEDSSLDNVWTLIKNSKATDAASLTVLQAFVMSLSSSALKHLIKTYLQSVSAQYSIDKNGLTPKQYAQRISNIGRNTITSPLHQSDQEILRKMGKKYGSKHNKRIMHIVQQNHSHNPHLLSVTPHIVSYSFQYLSFKELCKITSVCCYFTYLVHNYPALCHYHIHLNRSFFLSAMCNRIHLKHLSHFKSIEISAAYFGSSQMARQSVPRFRWTLFKHILHSIIRQSASNLKSLKINIKNSSGKHIYHPPNGNGNVLLQILNEHTTLPITTLKWFSDYFLPRQQTSHILNQINQKIHTKLPDLKHIVCGINAYQPVYISRADVPLSFMSRHIACIVNDYHHLKTLHLKCSHWNIYQNDSNVIHLIAQHLTKLEELTIISHIAADDTSFDTVDAMHETKHRSLKKLTAVFTCGAYENYDQTIQHILRKLFLVFCDIDSFSFGTMTLSIGQGMDWGFLFSLLRSMKHLQITSISYLDACNLMIQLDGALDSFDVCVVFPEFGGFYHRDVNCFVITKFGEFMTCYLVPFIKRNNNYAHSTLKHLKISFGKGQTEYAITDDIDRVTRVAEPTYAGDISSFYEPLLELLGNLPSSLQSLQLSLPQSNFYCHSQATKIVQKISDIAVSLELKNLESMYLENLKLRRDALSFMNFFFGFNNKIHREKKKLYLSFQ